MNNRLKIIIVSGVALAAFISISWSEIAVWIVTCMIGALATFIYVKQSPHKVHMLDGAQLGAVIGALGWLIVVLVTLSILLLKGLPFVAFAPDSLLLVITSLVRFMVVAGIGGLTVTLLVRSNRDVW